MYVLLECFSICFDLTLMCKSNCSTYQVLISQGGVKCTYTAATMVKVLTREILRRLCNIYFWMCDASSGVGSCNKLN